MNLSELSLQELAHLRQQIDDEIVHRYVAERSPVPSLTHGSKFVSVTVSEDEVADALEDLKRFGHTISHTYESGKLTVEYVDARDALDAFNKLQGIYEVSI